MAAAENIVVHSSDLATTILAGFGVALALLSLAWQAFSFRLSGSRISVEIRSGFRRGDMLVTAPWDPSPEEVGRLRAQGLTDSALSVTVTNSGRGPTSVTHVDVFFPNGAAYSDPAAPPSLPFRMEGESEQTWVLDRELVERYVKALEWATQTGEPLTIRGRVRVAGKKESVASANEIKVSQTDPSGPGKP
jgi:hypothetical protein